MRRLVAARRGGPAAGHGLGDSPLAPAICSPYAAEVDAIAAELGFPGIWFLNGCYQWGCTALACEQGGAPWLVRTLDWPFPGLGRHVEVARMRGAAGDFDNVTWPAYVGVLTASAPGRFAACINQAPMWRRTRQAWLRPYDIVLNARQTWGIRSIPPDHLLREVFETCKTFGEAKRRLETTPIARPVIYTLVGCYHGERCVIERTQDQFASRDHDTGAANDWLRSRPPWEARVGAEVLFTRTFYGAAENSRTRRDQLVAWSGPFEGKFGWVSPPVLNSQTRRRGRDVSCDWRTPSDRLRTGRRPGTARAGNIDLRTGGSHLKRAHRTNFGAPKGCATSTGIAGHAGAPANSQLTFHLGHSVGPVQVTSLRGGNIGGIYENW